MIAPASFHGRRVAGPRARPSAAQGLLRPADAARGSGPHGLDARSCSLTLAPQRARHAVRNAMTSITARLAFTLCGLWSVTASGASPTPEPPSAPRSGRSADEL